MKKLLAIAALFALAACTDEGAARRALNAAGFTNIQIGGYDAWMCGKGDSYATHFTATNPSGKVVEGTVCSGWGKGATIRF